MTVLYWGHAIFATIDILSSQSRQKLVLSVGKNKNRMQLLLYYVAALALAICGGLVAIFIWHGLADQINGVLNPLMLSFVLPILFLPALLGAFDISGTYLNRSAS